MTLTPEEQLMLELINRARANPEAEAARLGIDLNEGLAPGSIEADAKQPLAANELLQQAAEAHSEWMLRTDTFSHEGAGGSSIGDRIGETGYDWNMAGENIAWEGTTASLGDLAGRIASQHESLFLSAGHRRNLLNDAFTEVGIAQETGEFDGYDTSMVTQDFSDRDAPALLLGVVIDDRDDDDFYDVGEGLGGVTVTASGGGRSFTTETYAAGGYSLELPAGTYEIVFSGFDTGGEFAGTVTVGARNVKLDVETDDVPQPVADAGAPAGAGHPFDSGMFYPHPFGSGGITGQEALLGLAGLGGGGRDGVPDSIARTLILAELNSDGAGAHGPAMGGLPYGGAGGYQGPGPAGYGGAGGDYGPWGPAHLHGGADAWHLQWGLAHGGGGGFPRQLDGLSDPSTGDRFDFLRNDGPESDGFSEASLLLQGSGRDAPVHLSSPFGQLSGRDAPVGMLRDYPEMWSDTLAFHSGDDWV